MKKTLIIIGAIILLIGIVAGANTLSNLQGIDIPAGVIAGNTFRANFSFDYVDNLENKDNSPLIIKLNFSSEDQETYPVWKGDFEINGFIEKKSFFGFWTKTTYFDCSETAPLLINHSIGSEEISEIPDGTFYCFSESSDLKLNEKDIVYLDITSHQALWPGQYDLTAEMFYLNDTANPVVIILNKDYFNQYFRDGSYVDFNAKITDGSEISDYNAKIYTPLINISFAKEYVGENIYHFYQTLPITILEGNYLLKVIAKDEFENTGEDSTTLMIDRTGPEIELVEPTDGIYSEIIPIKFNVTDKKAGVDNETVQLRLREIKEGIGICPESGGPINGTGCITTPWITLTLNVNSSLFEIDMDTNYYNLTSGSYWLEAKAEDILGNKAEWIA